jgi:YidC/Oxa1 family membrane protein insertase
MEKRLIIAFALSFLVMLGWSYLSGTRQETAPVSTESIRQESLAAKPESGNLQDKTVQTRETGTAATDSKEEEINVETPLYQAVFTNKGATIKSFKLKKYKTSLEADSPFVELVNITDDSADFLTVNFGGEGTAAVKNVTLYDASQNSIDIAEGSDPKDLTFRSPAINGVSIDQTFRFYPDKYTVDLYVTLTNTTGAPVSGSVKTCLRDMPPLTKKGYSSFVGATLLLNNKYDQYKPSKLKDGKALSGQIGWIAYENDYFISSIIPEEQKEGGFYGLTTPSGVVSATYISPAISLSATSTASARYTLFFGPRDQEALNAAGKKLDRAINFGWFDIIAKPLHFLLRFFNRYVHNYGISIIILTILIKIIFWPLTHKSYVSMKEMQKLQPLMAKIREKYKDDREQMQRELMGLYKTYKVNPMGGCLPMVIQIPVFFALYRILGNSIELRQAPFMLWINDLSAPDRLFNFPFSIPFMYPPYGIPVLTLLMGASMFLQQKMSPPAGDPAQAKMMMFLPIVFTVMFINFPSGLVLYWLVNNVISIGQQYRIKKRSV